MTFQQEERRREELRKQEEAKQEEQRRIKLEEQQKKAREEEIRKKEEYERQQLLRRQEEERRRMDEMKRAEEERRRLEEMRRVEEEKRRQLELQRQEEERKQLEIMRYEQLKREEELKRQEEMRLEQEMRKQYEMQQQKIKMEQQEKMLQQQKDMERQTVRDHIPKIPKNKTFEASQQDRSAELKHEDHLLSIKTGQVNEKRNFWMRSSSVDRVNNVSSLSPAPRRRRIDWSAARKENDDPESRPGSSLGQANTGSVRNLTSGFLAKSKSSAAIVQDDNERGRPKQRSLVQNGWTKEKYDQELERKEFFKSQELKTNKVNETVQSWGRKESGTTSGRSTPAPSRHIGETFAENKIARSMTNVEQSKNANAWRTKTPEPSLKLVNVSVEKGMGSNQNIHISENAQRQMASFISSGQVQQQSRDSEVFTLTSSSFVTNTMSSQSSSIMSTSSKQSMEHALNNNNSSHIQPPPAPERNQSYGGKSALLTESSSPSSTSTVSIKDTHREATAEKVATTSPVSANNEQSVVTSDSANTNCCVTVSSPTQHQPLQNSTSAQSINSVLSSCSSNALPLPVKAGWYSSSSDNHHEESSTENTSNVSMGPAPDEVTGVLSPTKTGKTPVPVVANWFDNLENKFNNNKSKSEKPTSIEAAASDLDEILDELIVADLEIGQKQRPESRQKIFMTDDADNMSVRSDVTVIEKKPEAAAEDQKEASLLAVPQSPKEIRKKFQTAASSFEKSFTKSSEIEMSHEFKEGIKGKVKASKENFLKQMSSHQSLNLAENRSSTNNELQQIKLHRVASQGKIDPAEQDRSVDMMARQEKLAELEAVKRSRSKSRVRDETEDEVVQNSYTQEKREREMELIQLANRNANMTWDPLPVDHHHEGERQREEIVADRSLEIEELMDDQSINFSDGHYEAEWDKLQQANENINTEMSDLELSQQIWNERAEELRQMANIRPKSPWKSQEAEVDSKSKIRSTAAAWREREKSASRDRESPAAGQFTKDIVPTRRIGSLFNRDPDYWNLNDSIDDLPEPPPDMAPSPTPPTPVRQSSRGKIEEYSRDNARASPWRRC